MASGLDHKPHPMTDPEAHPDCSGKQERAYGMSWGQ